MENVVRTTCESIAAWTGRSLNKEMINPTSSARDDDDKGPSIKVINSTPLFLEVSADRVLSNSDNGLSARDLLGHQMPADDNEYCGGRGNEKDPSV